MEKIIFHQASATRFYTMMTAVNEVNNDKTKIRDEIISRSISLVCFTAEHDVYIDSQSMYT